MGTERLGLAEGTSWGTMGDFGGEESKSFVGWSTAVEPLEETGVREPDSASILCVLVMEESTMDCG